MGRPGGRAPRRPSLATVVLARDQREARDVADAIEAHRTSTPGTLIGEVVSVGMLVPADQAKKLPLVKEIEALATPENLAFLPPDKLLLVKQALPKTGIVPFSAEELPRS